MDEFKKAIAKLPRAIISAARRVDKGGHNAGVSQIKKRPPAPRPTKPRCE